MKLSKIDQDRLHEFYGDGLAQFGEHDSRSVRWSGDKSQRDRFAALMQVGDLNGKSVLDVGCGLGDLYKYFLEQEMEVFYTGIDIVPEFIESAKRKYPDARFEVKDIFEIEERYDVVLASGALSFKVANNQHYYQQMIAKMYEVCIEAVGFNMLDKRLHVDNETYAAYLPTEIADYCSTLAERVEIITDYIPKDFTVFMYK